MGDKDDFNSTLGDEIIRNTIKPGESLKSIKESDDMQRIVDALAEVGLSRPLNGNGQSQTPTNSGLSKNNENKRGR